MPHTPTPIPNQSNEPYWDYNLPIKPIPNTLNWYHEELTTINNELKAGAIIAEQMKKDISNLIEQGRKYLYLMRLYEQLMNKKIGYAENKCVIDNADNYLSQPYPTDLAYYYTADSTINVISLKYLLTQRLVDLKKYTSLLNQIHVTLIPIVDFLKVKQTTNESVFPRWNNNSPNHSASSTTITGAGDRSIFARSVDQRLAQTTSAISAKTIASRI
jgi:hypothetical protein